MSNDSGNLTTLHPPVDLHGQDLVLTRVFDAPRERVWRAWTEADIFARWFGPHGTTLPFCTLDARPGGELHFLHRHARGDEVWVKGTYAEVVAPDRLVLDMGFSDAEGNDVPRPGFADVSRITITLASHPRGTEVTVRHAGLVVDQGESAGWRETLDRLGELVAAAG